MANEIASVKTIDGRPVAPMGLEIVRGAVPGWSGEIKFGDRESVGTSEVTIWGVPGTTDNYFPTSAVSLSISSSSANDTAAGTGARTGTITYLDGDLVEGTETFTLNGTTPVALTNQMKRINRIEIDSAGSTGHNEGTIYVFEGTATAGVPNDLTKIVNGITINHNQTTSAFYTVPANKRAYFMTGLATSAGNKNATIRFRVRDNGVFQVKLDFDLLNSPMNIQPAMAFPLIAETDVRATGLVDTGTGRISVSFSMFIEDWTRA